MGRPLVHLVECLDAAGAAPDDGLVRAAALERAGYRVRVVAVHRPEQPPADLEVTRVPCLAAGASARDAVREWIDRGRPDVVVVASAGHAGGSVASWIPESWEPRWWPSGVQLLDAEPAPSIEEEPEPDPLQWSVVDVARCGRPCLPLWDGAYVLVPAPIADRAGERLLVTFAEVARDRDGLELVVLMPPDARLERAARRHGIGPRVHFAGTTTRAAEPVWNAFAAAVMMPPAPLSGGLALRVMASGRPPVVTEDDVASRALARWLVRNRVAPAGSPAERLARALEEPTAEGTHRIRSVAARHDIAALAARLTGTEASEIAVERRAA